MLRPPPSSDFLSAALRESEQKFSVIFQNARFGISLATLPEQIVVDVNPAWERLFGFTKEEAIGKTFTDLQITDEAESQHSSTQGRIRHPVRDAETAVRTKSGAVRIVCCSHDQVTLASGQYLLSTLQDVTDRVQADSELRYANETIIEILQSITDAFCAFDRNWLYTYVNDQAVRLLGKSREQLIGYSPWALFPDRIGEYGYNICVRAMSERVPVSFEEFVPSFDKWFASDIYPTKDGVAICWRDITQRKQSEERLRRSEAYLAQAQKMTQIGSWAWNPSTGELFWSDEHFRICGLDPQSVELTKEIASRILHPDESVFVMQAFDKAVSERTDFDMEYRFVRPDGTVRYVHGRAVPVFDGDGKLIEYFGTVLDITERRQMEEALRTALVELAHLNRVSTVSELATSLAHELNQPLTAAVTNASACLHFLERDRPDLDEARGAAKDMVNAVFRASDVVKGIRSMVRRVAPEQELLDLNGLIPQALSFAKGQLTANQIVLQKDLQPGLPAVLGDKIQLQQVVLNLVLNAVHALTLVEGSREICVRSQATAPSEVTVTVQDSGIGINQEQSERMFVPFYSTRKGGLGLGLSISRTIIEGHGGKLWVTQNEGKGASFHFMLPIADVATNS